MNFFIKEIVNSIKQRKNLFIICVFVVGLGILLGCFLSIKSEFYDIHAGFVLNYYLEIFTLEKLGLSFIISRFVSVLLLLLLVALLCINKYTIYINFLILFYRAFIIGLAGKLLILEAFISGIFIFLFLVVIKGVIICFSITLFILIIYKRNNKFNNCLITLLSKTYFLTAIIAIIGCALELLLILVIFKPLNLLF